MNRNKLILIVCLVLLLNSCASPSPSSNLVQVKGVLVDKVTHAPIEDVVLQLWRITITEDGSAIGKVTSKATTDSAGAFLFTDVPPDKYVLEGYWDGAYLNVEPWYGDRFGDFPVIEINTGPIIDLGILEDCPYQHCGLPPTITPTEVP